MASYDNCRELSGLGFRYIFTLPVVGADAAHIAGDRGPGAAAVGTRRHPGAGLDPDLRERRRGLHHQAILRHRTGGPGGGGAAAPDQGVFQLGELAVDYARRWVTVEGRAVALTETEYRLLC